MNSKATILITSLLAFALLANVSNVGSVFATGGLDDEEEEEAIEELQNAVEEIKGTLGTIELNLTEGSNDIEANCPTTEEIVQEVVNNITEQENNVTEQPTCPFVEPVQNNVTEPAEPQPAIPPQQNNLTCPFAPVEEPAAPVPQENTTQVIEEIIENVTTGQPVCNIPPQEIIPDIVLPNVTEPEPQEQPICNLTGQPVEEEQQNNNVTEPATQGAPFQQQQQQLQDEQEVATIEFEASCGCFVVDKSPQEVQ